MHEPLLKFSDILMLIAVIAGPVLAVQAQKWIEGIRDLSNRRLWIFKTLMATRGSILSIDHVGALNRIDLEFYGNKKYHQVIDAWNVYYAHLNKKSTTEAETVVWYDRQEDLLADLLFEMGTSLGYKFDKALIKRHVYSPQAHGNLERENELIRKKLIELLMGEINLPIAVEQVAWNEEATINQQKLQGKQSLLWDLMIEHYTNEINRAKQSNGVS